MTAQSKPDLTDAPAVVVFGRDEAGKPHASSFTTGEVKLAETAASLMKLKVLPIRTEPERALAAQVPKGRIFASGRAFLPFIKAALFLELQTATLNAGVKPPNSFAATDEGGSGATSTRTPALPPVSPKGGGIALGRQPCGWADLRVGARVLTMDPPYRDWFEAEVIAIEGGELFTLRWRDWPGLPPVVRRRVQLGLMHPAHQPQPPLDPNPPTKAA